IRDATVTGVQTCALPIYLPAKSAAGVDGVTKAEYGRDLESNLQDLSERLGRLGYRPQPVRRAYIPKPGTDQQRPLGILCTEDKRSEERRVGKEGRTR